MSNIFEYRDIIKDARVKITELDGVLSGLYKKQERLDKKYAKCKTFAEACAVLAKYKPIDKDITEVKGKITELNKLVYRTDKLLIAEYNRSANMELIGW